MTQYGRKLEAPRDVYCSWSGLYKVFSEGLWVGAVQLMNETRKQIDQGGSSNGLHTFIAISQSGDADDDVWEIEDGMFDPDADPDWVAPYDASLKNVDEGHVFNVLLVQGGQPDYTRLGMGQIHRASCRAGKAEKKMVRLA